MNNLVLLGEVAPVTDPITFVKAIIDSVTTGIPLATIATILGSIITAGLVGILMWKFGRKGYAFVVNALTGRKTRI